MLAIDWKIVLFEIRLNGDNSTCNSTAISVFLTTNRDTDIVHDIHFHSNNASLNRDKTPVNAINELVINSL